MRMLAHCEAYIDFEADELSDPRLTETFKELTIDVQNNIGRLKGYLKDYESVELIKEGFKVSILGPPNAGKSTLINMLSRRDVAIVSDVPGTTRDVISTNLSIKGVNVLISDTAGLRSGSQDPIEN